VVQNHHSIYIYVTLLAVASIGLPAVGTTPDTAALRCGAQQPRLDQALLLRPPCDVNGSMATPAAWLALCVAAALLASDAAHGQQLSATIATGSSFPLGQAGAHTLLFKPAASGLGPELGAVLLPDAPGEYVVRGSDGNDTVHIQAVELARWAADALPIMADAFGANSAPTDSSSGSGFWSEDLLSGSKAAGCLLEEDPSVGLRISTGGGPGPCGLRTRDGCPHGTDPAVTSCGFASGATSVNPFNDRLAVSLGNLTLGSSGATGAVRSQNLCQGSVGKSCARGSKTRFALHRLGTTTVNVKPLCKCGKQVRLTSAEAERGAIELMFNSSAAVLRWTTATTGRSSLRWTELHSAPLSRCNGAIANISMTLSITQARFAFMCADGGGSDPEENAYTYSSAVMPHGINWRTFAPSRSEKRSCYDF
jgi:hypothetical protein